MADNNTIIYVIDVGLLKGSNITINSFIYGIHEENFKIANGHLNIEFKKRLIDLNNEKLNGDF